MTEGSLEERGRGGGGSRKLLLSCCRVWNTQPWLTQSVARVARQAACCLVYCVVQHRPFNKLGCNLGAGLHCP